MFSFWKKEDQDCERSAGKSVKWVSEKNSRKNMEKNEDSNRDKNFEKGIKKDNRCTGAAAFDSRLADYRQTK